MQKMRQDAAFEIQRNHTETWHKTHLASTELEDVVKCKDFKLETFQSELARAKQKALTDLEKERAEYEISMPKPG